MDNPAATDRKILVHYHLFKNGGTSIEKLLKGSLGTRWASFDRPEPGAKIAAEEMQAWIEAHPDVRAVSSHQLVPPVPTGNFTAYPVVFLRHPLARVRSAYLFEWQKQLGLNEPRGTLAEFVEDKFSQKNTSIIANFQVSRLSNINYDDVRQRLHRHNDLLLPQAMAFIDSLPFVGLVERFSESIAAMQRNLGEHFPDIVFREYHENVLQKRISGPDQLNEELRAEIGPSLFDELLLRNALDLQLYSYALGRFEQDSAAQADQVRAA